MMSKASRPILAGHGVVTDPYDHIWAFARISRI
jgi:hypothetical protein